MSIQVRNKTKYYYVTIRYKGVERSLYLGKEGSAGRWADFFGQPPPASPEASEAPDYRRRFWAPTNRGRSKGKLAASLAALGSLASRPSDPARPDGPPDPGGQVGRVVENPAA